MKSYNVTNAAYDSLPTAEKNILTLVIFRLFTAVYIPYEYTSTKVLLDCEKEEFTATGREIKELGFKGMEATLHSMLTADKKKKKGKQEDGDKVLPPMAEGNADKELKEALKDSGLGTPATRAGIIENIINTGYIVCDGKNLLATDKTVTFMPLVVDKIKQPELTGEWEKQLADIQKGQQTEAAFIGSVTGFLRSFIGDAVTLHKPEDTKDTFKRERKPQEQEIVGKCPKCGADVIVITAKAKTEQDKPKKYYVCEKDKNKCSFILGEFVAGKKSEERTYKPAFSTDCFLHYIINNGERKREKGV